MVIYIVLDSCIGVHMNNLFRTAVCKYIASSKITCHSTMHVCQGQLEVYRQVASCGYAETTCPIVTFYVGLLDDDC